MFKSLRYRLLIWFVLSTVLIVIFSFSFFQLYKSTKSKQQLAQANLNFFRLQFLKDQTNVANFLASETSNQNFYISGESEHLSAHYKNLSRIDSCYINFLSKKDNNHELQEKNLVNIRNSYTNYCLLLDSLVYKIYQRGYKNFGLEGELASYIYRAEKLNMLSKANLTELRLAEREYITRQDTSYLSQVNSICNSLITNILYNSRYSPKEKSKIVEVLKSYKNTFNEIVNVDKEIGLNNATGLRQELSIIGHDLEKLVNYSIREAEQTYKTNMLYINIGFVIFGILLIAISIIISIYTSKYLVQNLVQLTSYIHSLAENNFKTHQRFDLRNSTREIQQIYLEFRNILADLRIREKQRDLALKTAEDNNHRYQELADLLPQCIYETDRLGNLSYVNKAWHETFGYTKYDVNEGINLLEIINADSNSLLGFSKIENNDFIATRKDGSKFPSTVYSDVIKKGARVIGRRGIIIDSSLRNKYIESLKKETVKAIASDKHKSSFLANMSHEIRTPMNSIIGFTNMLASKEIPDELKSDFIGHIQTSSEMLLNLIDDIIDIAKIEDGQLTIKKGDCEPIKLIESLAANFEAYKNRLDKEHLKLKLSLPEKNILFRTDAFRLKQILTNLISNAIKFTEQGSIEVGLTISNNRMLEFYVEDTGMGMSKKDLQTIFERFKRTKLSEEKKISGTGLGLAISKNLVEMLDGNMWVSSEVDEGTRFSFELPYVRVAESNDTKTEEISDLSYNWQNKKFLVAEDDENGFTYICHILEKTGVKIVHANNGKEAVDALSFHKDIDLVLTDLRMPVMNGLEATTRIKEQFPQLPIIAQTAFAMEGDRNKCIAAGCDDYITKPLHAESLLAKIAQFIDSSALKTEEINSEEEKNTGSISKTTKYNNS